MRALPMVVSLLWVNAHAATLDGVDQIITEPATGRELLAMLDSPDTRKAGMYFILGVIEGHLVTQTGLIFAFSTRPLPWKTCPGPSESVMPRSLSRLLLPCSMSTPYQQTSSMR